MSALNRGMIAAVIDGACRDVEEIRRIRGLRLSSGSDLTLQVRRELTSPFAIY